MFLQHSFQFLMYCILRGRQHPQIDDACAEIVGKDKSAKVPVAYNENAALVVGHSEQVGVAGLGEPDARHSYDIVPCLSEPAHGRRPDILIREESHAVTVAK